MHASSEQGEGTGREGYSRRGGAIGCCTGRGGGVCECAAIVDVATGQEDDHQAEKVIRPSKLHHMKLSEKIKAAPRR